VYKIDRLALVVALLTAAAVGFSGAATADATVDAEADATVQVNDQEGSVSAGTEATAGEDGAQATVELDDEEETVSIPSASTRNRRVRTAPFRTARCRPLHPFFRSRGPTSPCTRAVRA
jgi:hypothetical protein